MTEPDRIGLTPETSSKLEELLEELNPTQSQVKGTTLIKFDLYRLAVAVGIKNDINPSPLNNKSTSSFRVSELDKDGILYTVAKNKGLEKEGESVYELIERMAEHQIKYFYDENMKTGQLPFDEIFSR
ncbi:hypothetical protein [Teredinibacter turnerae]|uniref:hypothetical protein n=1 Tax=Teredinibacter turnerae TaxID=2426 RepID=UPI00048FCCA5|nr:hypothetical protein [Teredinibacter turnerae]